MQPPTSRRERLRAEALTEIKRLGMGQVAEGGPSALSLNAIAKQMGMSGPAIYRYFASRDDLLAALVVDAYEDLASALRKALEQAARRTPEHRVRAVANAYRAWALEHAGTYPLLLTGGLARGEQPLEIAAASQGAMEPLLAALRDLPPGGDGPSARLPSRLAAQLTRWARDRGADDQLPPWLLRLAVVTWQRMHGHIELELEGVHAAMGLSSDALYRTEVDAIIAEATRAGTT